MRHFALISIKILMIFAVTCSMGYSEGLSAGQKKDGETLLTPGPYPEIQFDELSYDFGKVFQNETFEHTFYFKNIGTGNLNIIKVKAG